MSGTQGTYHPVLPGHQAESPRLGVGSAPGNLPTNQRPLSPFSIRQLKERVTNLRGKHKQIYNLAVKEVDPQVNWAALVEEKLVRPKLQLGRAPCVCRENPTFSHHHSPSGKESCSPCFLTFVSMRRARLREAQLLAQNHTAEVVAIRTLLGSPLYPGLLGSWQAGGSSQISGRSLPSPCPPAHLQDKEP